MMTNEEPLLHLEGHLLPEEFCRIDTYCLWKYKSNDSERHARGKHPLDWTNSGKGNNHPSLHMGLDQAIQKINQIPNAGLCVFQPETGINLNVEGKDGHLFILDLDGFICQDDITEAGREIIKRTNYSYFEISPSGVGLKLFIVSDMQPFGKKIFKLPPNEFSKSHPEIRKYGDGYAVEVFSSKFWNVITGNRYSSKASTLKFMNKGALIDLLGYISSLSKPGTIKEVKKSISILPKSEADKNYAKLTKFSLEEVLAKIDNSDEELWGGGQAGGGVVNILARVYGEGGREQFLKWSKGDFASKPYPQYSADECNKRFDRALYELVNKPNGFGIKQLCKLAKIDPILLEFEPASIPTEFEALFNKIKLGQNLTKSDENNFSFPALNKKNRPIQVTQNLGALIAFKRITIRYNQISKNPEILMPGLQCVLDEIDC